MDRTESFRINDCSSVRAIGAGTEYALLPAGSREWGELGADASDRRAILADALLRQPQARGATGRQSQAGAAADAGDGDRSDLSQAADHLAGSWPPDLFLLATERGRDSERPGVVERYHVYPFAAGLFVS